MNRRDFIVVASGGFFAAAFLPLPALSAPNATRNALTWFAVGTEGEFDWKAVLAPDLRTAKIEWLEGWGLADDIYLEDHLDRLSHTVPSNWQSMTQEPEPHDWIHAGMGYHCSRCGYETCADFGALVVGKEVVCEDCAKLPDYCVAEPETATELIRDCIIDNGVKGAREYLIERGYWAAIPIHIWSASMRSAKT